MFKSCNILQIKITWAIQQILICSEIWLVQKEKFRFKGNNQQLCSNSIFTGKRLWWRSFKCSCWYEGLQLYEKVTLSQVLSSGFCEVLQNIICEENCWSTASDFLEHFRRIACFVSNKSTNCLGLPETAVHKQLTLLALQIFKDNQNIAKVESNILLMRSTRQRKWMVLSRSSHHPNVFCKKSVFWNIRQTHWKTSLAESFFAGCRPGTLVNKCFSVNGCKRLCLWFR